MKALIKYVLVYAGVAVVACSIMRDARSQTAQETVERQIGSLVVNNAQCTANAAALQAALDKARAEIDALKKAAEAK